MSADADIVQRLQQAVGLLNDVLMEAADAGLEVRGMQFFDARRMEDSTMRQALTYSGVYRVSEVEVSR